MNGEFMSSTILHLLPLVYPTFMVTCVPVWIIIRNTDPDPQRS